METKLNLKCYKTFLGFRKKCIGEKCAMWVTLYFKDEKGENTLNSMCVHKAHNVIFSDIARALFTISQKK
jgi:hypothetical protein